MWILSSSLAIAATFEVPLNAPGRATARAVMADGSVVEGNPGLAVAGSGTLKKVKMKLADGSKTTLSLDDVKELYLVPNGFSRVLAAANAMGSVAEMDKTSGARSLAPNEVLFVAGQLPNGKTRLMQLLNPGFDATLQILADPAGRETAGLAVGGLSVTGGVSKSYLVLRRGETMAFLVKKGSYDKQWTEIFGTCAGFETPASPDWDQFADQVSRHAESCATP